MAGNDKTQVAEGKPLKERIGSLMSEKELADVHFIVGESKTLISAHKTILATCSEVFFAMFCGPLAVTTTDTIPVTDITPKGFCQMLKYIYTDDVTLENEDDAFETYKAADKYLVSGLRGVCLAFLTKVRLCPDTAASILENALLFNISTLINRCSTYIKDKTKAIMMSQGFLCATPHTVKSILALDQLNVPSESDAFEMIICWAVKQQEIFGEIKNLNEIIKPVLPLICFESISTEEFCSLVEKYPHAFSTEEALSLLMNYVKLGSKPLPEWFRRERRRKTALDTSIKVQLGTEILKMKMKRESWQIENINSCICGVFIKDVFQPIKVHGINIEWRILTQDLRTAVSVDHIATMNDSLLHNPLFEVAGQVIEMVSQSNFLQISFNKPVFLNQRLPFWIIVRLRFMKQITIKFQEYSGEKTEWLQCKVLQTGDYVPIVSQLLFSRCM